MAIHSGIRQFFVRKDPIRFLFWIGFFFYSFSIVGQERDEHLWQNISDIYLEADELTYSNMDSSILLLDSAFSMVAHPYDTSLYADMLGLKGYNFQVLGHYDSSMHYYLQTLQFKKHVRDSLGISHSYIYMANLSYFLNDYENCRSFSKKALEVLRNIRANGRDFANCYNVFALTYFDQDQLDSALKYFLIGLSYLENDSIERESAYTSFYDNIGQILEEKDLKDEAIAYYRKSLKISLAMGWVDDQLWTYNRLIQTFLSERMLDSARKYVSLSRSIFSKSADRDIKKDIVQSEAIFYGSVHQLDSMKIKLIEYSTLAEELIEARTKANIQEMAAKYDLERKESALAIAKEHAARLKQETKNQRILLFFAVIGLVVLLLILFFLRKFYHQRRRMSLMELEIKDNKLDELMASQESKTYAAMLRGQQQERERIARDLHDRLGGTLAALKHSLRSPDNKIKKEDLEIVDQAVKEVRDVSHNLASTQFADFGLSEALNQLKSTIENVGEVKFGVYLHPSTSKLEQKVTIELYRIVQELLSNTLKHADANEISVQTNFTDNVFNLIYEDNGSGFDPKNVQRGMGIDNMRARVKRIDGVMNIDAEIGRGTIVIIEINQQS